MIHLLRRSMHEGSVWIWVEKEMLEKTLFLFSFSCTNDLLQPPKTGRREHLEGEPLLPLPGKAEQLSPEDFFSSLLVCGGRPNENCWSCVISLSPLPFLSLGNDTFFSIGSFFPPPLGFPVSACRLRGLPLERKKKKRNVSGVMNSEGLMMPRNDFPQQ